jgi:hypothetical protein
LSAADNDTDGSNGLPSITSPLTIVGAGAGNTFIEREAAAPRFRLLHVAQTGLLKLIGVTATGGLWGSPFVAFGGGGLLNHGTAIIDQSALTGNVTTTGGSGGGGGGLWTAEGSMTIIIGSTIADNRASEGHGGGLLSASTAVAIVNSTLARNSSNFSGFGGALSVPGGIIVNTTIANNTSFSGGQALRAGSALALFNTIVAGPSEPASPACLGAVTSLGNNLFIDPGCAVALLSQDLTGDARLGDYTDDGTPGHGFIPLLKRSPAIDAGDEAACLPADQRGRRRAGKSCDIGAIEGTHP